MKTNKILCIKWGNKYDDSYVEKLKEQCENNCSVPFDFYCLTDNPTKDYHVKLPIYLDDHYDEEFKKLPIEEQAKEVQRSWNRHMRDG